MTKEAGDHHLQCLLSNLQVLIDYLIDFKVFISVKITNIDMLKYIISTPRFYTCQNEMN